MLLGKLQFQQNADKYQIEKIWITNLVQMIYVSVTQILVSTKFSLKKIYEDMNHMLLKILICSI